MKERKDITSRVDINMSDVKRVHPSSILECDLCNALKREIETCHTDDGETERRELLAFLLKEHQKACHDSK